MPVTGAPTDQFHQHPGSAIPRRSTPSTRQLLQLDDGDSRFSANAYRVGGRSRRARTEVDLAAIRWYRINATNNVVWNPARSPTPCWILLPFDCREYDGTIVIGCRQSRFVRELLATVGQPSTV
jgi:hypothetical protein